MMDNPAILTWAPEEAEQAMADGHGPAWRAIIRAIKEGDLSGYRVLDFGCNRGGFLRTLYYARPFASGVGIDLAEDSLVEAQRLSSGLPLAFGTPHLLQSHQGFDLCFSHEVVYLLSDLALHARTVSEILKPGGIYYLALGEHTSNPFWSRWKDEVAGFSPVAPQSYCLEDIARAFREAGFAVSLRRLTIDEFLPWPGPDAYLRDPFELLTFMYEGMVVFRLRKETARWNRFTG